MYEIAVCDDDDIFISSFKAMLTGALDARKENYHLTLFHDPASLLLEMERGRQFHLLFLDIYYETEKGIRFARLLRKRNYPTDIVFITSLSNYAIESYDIAPLHYLMKPISPEKLETALTRFFHKNTPNKLHFITSAGHLYVSISDILFFEIYGHEIVIHLAGGTKASGAGTLKELERLLPDDIFVRPHRSYLVNMEHISRIARYEIQLTSGDTVPVSKNLYNSILNSFISYANQNSISF